MTTIPGLFALGEANFSDHGANRLGASALMQGLADGYYVIPYTIGDFLAEVGPSAAPEGHPAIKEAEDGVRQQVERLMATKGKKTVLDFHRELGAIMWNRVGMARDEENLAKAVEEISRLREEFWSDVQVPGAAADLNKSLEFACRVADFLEMGELMARDALERRESCGGHFRLESQTDEGEALRDDKNYSHVAVWEYTEDGPVRHTEPLEFEVVPLTQRSYK
jgi:succinate dehydrogenase / fumarate reductase flavoprotein subunit